MEAYSQTLLKNSRPYIADEMRLYERYSDNDSDVK